MIPEALIRTARDNFFFAALQWAAMENGRFKYTDLPTGFNWTIDGETRYLKWEHRTEKGFRVWVLNQLRAALAVAAIQIDSVLRDYFGNEPYQDTDHERRAARCIMYMIRCAFAHNPLEPKWEVRGKHYADVFSVASANFTLNTGGLNGKSLDDANINWFKLLDLMDCCATLVS
ncbi:hypothetical protein ACFLWY_03355 [Chloroflexota bacterium]